MNDPMIDTLAKLVADAEAKGHESMILSVSRPTRRRRRPRVARGQVEIARGLRGRWMGDLQGDVEGHIVDVSVADAKAWLKRRGQ